MTAIRSSLARTLILAPLAIAAAAPAHAGGLFSFDPAEGSFYGSIYGGGVFTSGTEFSGVSDPVAGVPGPTGNPGIPLNAELDYSTGYNIGGSVGGSLPFRYWKYFQPRLEIEVSYTDISVDGGSFNGGSQVFSGSQEALSILFNNYTDIIFSENQRFTPYVGGGIGVAFVDSFAEYFPPANSAIVFAVNGEDTALAGHFAIGGTFDLTDQFEIFTEARYFRIQDVALERSFTGGGDNLFVGGVSDDIDGIAINAGIRLRF